MICIGEKTVTIVGIKWKYVGELDLKLDPCGQGVATTEDGKTTHTGTFYNGTFEGIGRSN